jgi:uncharacterized protein YjcR
LAGEMTTNAEIAAHLRVKAHTVGKWRRAEDWNGLRLKVDRRAAEKFVEEIATERSAINVRHYRSWGVLESQLYQYLKDKGTDDLRELERAANVLERTQKGQRLAKGMSIGGETEEALHARYQAEIRGLIDTFIESVKENIPDEETRDRIRRSVLERVPAEEDAGAGHAEDAGAV